MSQACRPIKVDGFQISESYSAMVFRKDNTISAKKMSITRSFAIMVALLLNVFTSHAGRHHNIQIRPALIKDWAVLMRF